MKTLYGYYKRVTASMREGVLYIQTPTMAVQDRAEANYAIYFLNNIVMVVGLLERNGMIDECQLHAASVFVIRATDILD